jgi:spoIIIJ-associated protein
MNNDSLKLLVEELIKKLDPEATVSIFPVKDATMPIDIKVQDPDILIGPNGETLLELQHLLKAILKRKLNESIYVDLDINNYKKKKAEYLKELARACANDVSLSHQAKVLAPMAAYERRIIHLELVAREDVATESVGEGPARKVVIKPRS